MLYRPPTCTSSSPIPMAVPLSATIADPCCMGLFTRDSSATVSILLRRNVCEAWPTSDQPIGQFSVIWQSLKPLPVECLRYYLLPQPISPPLPPVSYQSVFCMVSCMKQVGGKVVAGVVNPWRSHTTQRSVTPEPASFYCLLLAGICMDIVVWLLQLKVGFHHWKLQSLHFIFSYSPPSFFLSFLLAQMSVLSSEALLWRCLSHIPESSSP